jgi:hypothetical protein
MSAGLVREAARRRIAVNPGFGGLRGFTAGEDVQALWRRDLAAMPAGGVLMVHPGPAEGEIGPARAAEAELIAAGAVSGLMDELGLEMASAPRAPWA